MNTIERTEQVLEKFEAWADEIIGAYEETPTHTATREAYLQRRIETLRSAKMNLRRFVQEANATNEGKDDARRIVALNMLQVNAGSIDF